MRPSPIRAEYHRSTTASIRASPAITKAICTTTRTSPWAVIPPPHRRPLARRRRRPRPARRPPGRSPAASGMGAREAEDAPPGARRQLPLKHGRILAAHRMHRAHRMHGHGPPPGATNAYMITNMAGCPSAFVDEAGEVTQPARPRWRVPAASCADCVRSPAARSSALVPPRRPEATRAPRPPSVRPRPVADRRAPRPAARPTRSASSASIRALARQTVLRPGVAHEFDEPLGPAQVGTNLIGPRPC